MTTKTKGRTGNRATLKQSDDINSSNISPALLMAQTMPATAAAVRALGGTAGHLTAILPAVADAVKGGL